MKKQYLNDPIKNVFDTQITSIKNINNQFSVSLKETYFFQGGGGQLADKGTIEGVNIINFHEDENNLFYLLESELEINVGDTVNCQVDSVHRWDLMQQHTGQHILSQSIERVMGLSTLSFQMKENISQIHIPYTDNYIGLIESEKLANSIIYEMLEVTPHNIFPDDENYKLRKAPLEKYLDKDGKIRIIKIGEFETIPCGGTHCLNTGQIGIIKIIAIKKKKKIMIIDFVCGYRALNNIQNKILFLNEATSFLSCSEDTLLETLKDKNSDKVSLENEYSLMKEELQILKAKEIASDFIKVKKIKIVQKQFLDTTPINELISIAKLIIQDNNYICLFSSAEKFTIMSSLNIDINLNSILEENRAYFNIKGGGRGNNIQGAILEKSLMKDLFEKFIPYE